MDNIDLEQLDDQSLIELQAILEGMNDLLKEEEKEEEKEGENNE